MPRLRLLTPVALAVALLPADADATSIHPSGPTPPPNTWAVGSPDGTLLFVMRGATEDETEHPLVPEAVRERSRELWRTYPRSGLYLQLTGELLWATSERMEMRTRWQQHHVTVTNAGVVVWTSHAPYGPPKCPRRHDSWWRSFGNQTFVMASAPGGAYSESRDGLAVRVIADGRSVLRLTPKELIADPEAFADVSAFGYKPWLAELEADDDRLALTALDGQRVTFDLTTGVELDRQPPGGSSLLRPGLMVGGLLLVAGALALRRKRVPVPAVAPTPLEAELFPEPDPLVVTPPPPGLGRRRSGWHVPVRR